MQTTDLKLADLVSLPTLERIQELFHALSGIPVLVTDEQGKPLTAVGDPLQFCGALLGGYPGTVCLRRARWDVPDAGDALLHVPLGDGKPLAHRCRGGFRDTTVPIMVESQTLGYLVFARSLPSEPDLGHFRALAREGGMAEEVGEKVARAALVMPEEKIAQVAEFLQLGAGLIAQAAYDSLRARQVLELEQLRDSLVHMIVHDLRTPLTSILSGLQTIVEAGFDQTLVTEFVPYAIDDAGVLLEMINTLLDVNKMESGEMALDRQAVVLSEITERAVSQVRSLLADHGHQLSVHVPDDCPPAFLDGDKIRRLLVNLLGNAIKFTPAGGSITLSAECELTGLTFSVSDTGPGIPEEERERIFEKFGQVAGRAQNRPSTGLGLTFCKMVAEAHGGSISVDNAPGGGSIFTVVIPLS